jgi:hypothetical protein
MTDDALAHATLSRIRIDASSRTTPIEMASHPAVQLAWWPHDEERDFATFLRALDALDERTEVLFEPLYDAVGRWLAEEFDERRLEGEREITTLERLAATAGVSLPELLTSAAPSRSIEAFAWRPASTATVSALFRHLVSLVLPEDATVFSDAAELWAEGRNSKYMVPATSWAELCRKHVHAPSPDEITAESFIPSPEWRRLLDNSGLDDMTLLVALGDAQSALLASDELRASISTRVRRRFVRIGLTDGFVGVREEVPFVIRPTDRAITARALGDGWSAEAEIPAHHVVLAIGALDAVRSDGPEDSGSGLTSRWLEGNVRDRAAWSDPAPEPIALGLGSLLTVDTVM